MADRVQRRLTAILSADVVSYSRLMGSDETGTLSRLKALRESIFDPAVAAYGGRIIKLMGDGCLVEFVSVIDAVACALDIQAATTLDGETDPSDKRLSFRMGINIGDIIVDGDDIYGDGVNIAARIEALADPGSVFISRNAAEEVRGKLPLVFEFRGERRVKNIARPIEVFRVVRRESQNAPPESDDQGLGPLSFAWPPDNDRDRAPFRGLKPLEALDAGVFFGREAPIADALERVRATRASHDSRLVVILGASGAGKSSFLRAGLLPRLARDDCFLPAAPVQANGQPLTNDNGLIGAIQSICPGSDRSAIRAAVQSGASAIHRLLRSAIDESLAVDPRSEPEARDPTIVLAIDQAEDLFRSRSRDEGPALLDLIRDLSALANPKILTIFVIRSDSYDKLQWATSLEGLSQTTLSLPPMPRASYKEVIEGPIRRVVASGRRLSIDPQLIDSLLTDIETGGSDALPLLSLTLEHLYEDNRSLEALRLADYRTFGGIKGVIDAAVERVFARADGDPRIPRDQAAREALLRRGLIPWLAGIDPDSRSPRRNRARRADIPPEAVPLVELLVEERLLSTDTAALVDPRLGTETLIVTLEPTHEALLRQWGLLHGWLTEDIAVLTILEGVRRATRDWSANGRSDAWLAHIGSRLTEATQLDSRPDIAANLDAIDRSYLSACHAKAEQERAAALQHQVERSEAQARHLTDLQNISAANRRLAKRTGVGLVIATILASAAGGFAFYAYHESRLANAAADVARAQTALAEAAKNEAQAQRDSANKATKQALAQRDAADAMRAMLQANNDSIDKGVLTSNNTIDGLAGTIADSVILQGDVSRAFAISLLHFCLDAVSKTSPSTISSAQQFAFVLAKGRIARALIEEGDFGVATIVLRSAAETQTAALAKDPDASPLMQQVLYTTYRLLSSALARAADYAGSADADRTALSVIDAHAQIPDGDALTLDTRLHIAMVQFIASNHADAVKAQIQAFFTQLCSRALAHVDKMSAFNIRTEERESDALGEGLLSCTAQ